MAMDFDLISAYLYFNTCIPKFGDITYFKFLMLYICSNRIKYNQINHEVDRQSRIFYSSLHLSLFFYFKFNGLLFWCIMKMVVRDLVILDLIP